MAPDNTGVCRVSLLRFITEGQESEPRVVKAQLALAASTARNTRVTSPVWAAAAAILCSTGRLRPCQFRQDPVRAAGGDRGDGRQPP